MDSIIGAIGIAIFVAVYVGALVIIARRVRERHAGANAGVRPTASTLARGCFRWLGAVASQTPSAIAGLTLGIAYIAMCLFCLGGVIGILVFGWRALFS